MTKNHFSTLELKPGANDDDIKKAYRTLAKKWHPDKNQSPNAEEKFKEISAAYEVLKNKDSREIHERDLNRAKFQAFTRNNFHQEKAETFRNKDFDESSESSWSKKFGQKSESRYKNSSFGHFADEGKPSGSYKKQQEGTKKQEPKQGPRRRRVPKQRSAPNRSSNGFKPWSTDWNYFDDDDEEVFRGFERSNGATPRSHFSFAFKSFVDDLGMSFDAFFMGPSPGMGPWEFSAFFDGSDPFNNFHKQSFFNPLGPQSVPRQPRKHDVASEQGAEGLDPEYMFSFPNTRSHTPQTFPDNNTAGPESDDDDMDSRLFKCTYCEKRMPFSQLSYHEPGCALRRGGKFDMSDEEDHIYNFMGSPDEDQYPQRNGDWRQTHEELLQNIRRAKRAAKMDARQGSASTTRTTGRASTAGDEALAQIKCKWCGRRFSQLAAKQHIPFCERWTKEHGTPLNPKGKSPSRDLGSKNQKAREYAKHIPKPRRGSYDGESDSPRSPRSHFDHFPNVGVHTKRETMNKPGAASGTGLHSSYTPRDHHRSEGSPAPGSQASSSSSYAPRNKPAPKSNGPGRYSSPIPDNSYSSSVGDSYGFGVSGTRVRTDTRTRASPGDACSVCLKKYGAHGRILCSCGVRKTGA